MEGRNEVINAVRRLIPYDHRQFLQAAMWHGIEHYIIERCNPRVWSRSEYLGINFTVFRHLRM